MPAEPNECVTDALSDLSLSGRMVRDLLEVARDVIFNMSFENADASSNRKLDHLNCLLLTSLKQSDEHWNDIEALIHRELAKVNAVREDAA